MKYFFIAVSFIYIIRLDAQVEAIKLSAGVN